VPECRAENHVLDPSISLSNIILGKFLDKGLTFVVLNLLLFVGGDGCDTEDNLADPDEAESAQHVGNASSNVSWEEVLWSAAVLDFDISR
jgi:hypothetical protein